MSADTFQIRQGDTLPVLRYQLLGSNGIPADLTSATAVFKMQPAFGGTLKVNAAASVVPVVPVNITTKTLFSNAATLSTASPHNLTPGTTAVVAGVDSTFNGTWEVTSTPTPTSFTYLLSVSSPNIPVQSATGTVSVPGVVTYSWVSGDTDTIGTYAGSFVVTFTGGATQTFPSGSDSYIPIAVTQAVPAAHGLRAGPCLPWTDADAVRECVGGIDPTQDIDSWIEAASQILYALTGRQYKGLCIATIRPGHQECACGWGCGAHAWGWPFGGAFGYGPFGLPGWGLGWGWGRGSGGSQNILLCASQIDLGVDARQVLAVTINGQTVDPSTYRLDPRGKLVRQPDANGNMLVWPCFTGDVLVLTSRGLKPIESIQPGEMVLTHRNRWRRVLRAGQTGVSETVRVSGRGGEITCTPDHQFWASEVTPHDSSHSGTWNRTHRKLGAPSWIDASDLVGRTWATPRRVESLPVPLPDDRPLPANFWWFVGRWLGDGWTSNKAPSGHRGPGDQGSNSILLCAGHHEAEQVAAALAATGWRWKSHEQRTTVRFRLCDANLRLWLREQFGIAAHLKRIPAWMFGAPIADRTAFLDGYVSADGHYCDRSDGTQFITIRTVSPELALGVRLLASTLGFAPRMRNKPQTTTHIEGRPVKGRHTYSVDWPLTPPNGLNVQAWTDADHLWGRVRAITLDETVVPVYDLEVEEDHSFVADGFVTHNCCSRTDTPSGQPGTFEITYSFGMAPPESVVMACNMLAGQLALACNPGTAGQCKLPQHVQTMTRQGVTATFITDVTTILSKGFTGLPLVDLVIQSANPHHLMRRGRVVSIDIEPHRLMGNG